MTLTKKILPLAALLAVALPAGSAMAAPKPKAKMQFSQAAYAVAENVSGGHATVSVVRPMNGHSKVRLSQSATIDFTTVDGTAKAGVDYTAVAQTVSFPACPAAGPADANDQCVMQNVQIPIIDNSVVDGARTVGLKLSNPNSPNGRAILGYPSTATLVIADDDTSSGNPGSTFQLAAASDVVSESAGSETIFIVRSGDLSAATDVNYQTADGSAKDGVDYTATSNVAHFPTETTDAQGAILQTVSVPLLHNLASSAPTADFSFALSLPTGSTDALGSPSSETVTIVNSDGPPTLQFSSPSYTVGENGGSARMTVVVSGVVTGTDEVDVDYATADGTAIHGVNYTPQSDTLQFFAGDVAESFDVPVMADGQQGDKSFSVGLSNVAGGVIGTPATATVTIQNTDPAGGGTTQGANTSSNPGTVPNQGGVLSVRESSCRLTVKASKTQKLVKQKGLKLTLRSAQRCSVNLGATLKQLRATSKKGARSARALVLKGKKTSLTLQPGKTKTVTVKFTKKTLKAITKALRARNKKLVATVVVTERDSAAVTKSRTLKITIRR